MGSPDEVWDNLAVIGALRPAHLTWYHGRFADRPQGAWYKSAARHDRFEDEDETVLGRMLIWQGMAALGYARSDGNRFVRDRRHVDGFKRVRTSLATNLLGIGTSAYSHVTARTPGDAIFGRIFRNDASIQGYEARIAAGALPIATGRAIDAEELLAMSYATGLRQGRVATAALAAAGRRCPALAADYARRAQDLLDLGVLERGAGAGGALHLSDLGRLFEDEVLALFFSPTVKRVLAERERGAATAALPAVALA
ncbi:hypothetical protein [Sphingomonas hylomeconis]|uniref:Coproporphyrinogen III oxidase n=1 Tax=Sphingomonas hylomeconis TaxID=1395958 RepID=A0ABV7SV55_9SPHN|nr:hypothetical protein [Sphingomonas hylomeconis]